MTGRLVLVRHGESTANAAGVFTGSRDVDLSPRGVDQSRRAAQVLLDAGVHPNLVVTSRMRRARRTTAVMVAALAEAGVPTATPLSTWRLNERDYGLLMGMPKAEVRERYGAEAFRTWRRTRHGRPPPMPTDQRAELDLVALDADPGDPQTAATPGEGESLDDVVLRVAPLWTDRLLPGLRAGRTVLVVAHGNSLRALCALVDALDDDELEELNLPTAQPIAWWVDGAGRAVPRGGEFLDPETAWLEAVRIALEGGT